MSEKDKEQSQRFKEKARELGVEVDEEKLKRTLRKMRHEDQKKPNGNGKPGRSSD